MKNNLRSLYEEVQQTRLSYLHASGVLVDKINSTLDKVFGNHIIFVVRGSQFSSYDISLLGRLPCSDPTHVVKLPGGLDAMLYKSTYGEAALHEEQRESLGTLIAGVLSLYGVVITSNIYLVVSELDADIIRGALYEAFDDVQNKSKEEQCTTK